jgi:hypothetical protein
MVARCTPIASWMYFSHLDGLTDVAGVYTLAWRLLDVADDPWTARITRFKFGPNQEAAIRGATQTLETALPPLLEARGWRPAETAITAALSSTDTRLVPTKPLPRTASAVAQAQGMTCLSNLLTKQAHQRLHSLNSAAERAAEVEKAQYKSAAVPAGTRRVLVLDDLATRGDTLSAIAGAIQAATPGIEVVGIALGKNERKAFAADSGYNISNDTVPAAWATAWDQA